MKKSILVLIILLIVTQIKASNYALSPEDKNDTVFFESDAKLEFIAGKTNSIDGSFSFDVKNPLDSLYGVFRVDLNTLKTSIEARDKHMREEYLETDKFQYAFFEILSLENIPMKIQYDSSYSVIGDGNFYLHGKKNSLKPEISFMVLSDAEKDQINVTVEFHILLEDYDIERPKLVLLKVAKQINLVIKFSAFQVETSQIVELPSIYK